MVVYENPRISSWWCTYLSVYAIGACCMPLWRAKFELADGERSEFFDRCIQELGRDKKTTLPITSWSGRSWREQHGESCIDITPLNVCVATFCCVVWPSVVTRWLCSNVPTAHWGSHTPSLTLEMARQHSESLHVHSEVLHHARLTRLLSSRSARPRKRCLLIPT